ncbi:MAG: AraC family transcriptional regulator, partial [Phycisphaerales bacterium]|nr:AraC family transcriptional regulator [Phycisphaerales bacterium]
MAELIREIHRIGADSPERLVPGNVCPGLKAWGLEISGLTDAGVGYEMVRPSPPHGHIVVCTGGRGEVWVDGDWQKCGPGQAYVTPPLSPMGFRTVPKYRWQFGWAFLLATPGEPSPVSVDSATLIRVDPRQFINVIEGLYLEASGPARAEHLELWAQIVSEYVRAIARSTGRPDPLWRLWADVDNALSEAWTLERLADRAGLRPEALRRTCLKHFGRSPMRQVTHLRMRRAEALLRSTSGKLFTIARQVGYHNSFAFSTAFRRWKG